MTRFASLLAAFAVVAAGVPAATPALAQTQADEARLDQAQRRFDNELALYRQAVDQYRVSMRRGPASGGYYDPRAADPRATDPRYNDPRYSDDGYYDPRRDYRAGNYQERVLTRDDRVYRGTDGQYYCNRSDGSTGLIVGGAVGGVLGNVIDGGRSRVLGTLLGGAGGALLGRSIDQSQVRCR